MHFDSFGIDYITQEVLNKVKDKSITHNIFRIPYDDSIMCEFYCIVFIENMIAGKTLLDYTNLWQLIMAKESAGLAFRLKKIDETRNYLLEEIKHNELIR